MDDALQPDTQSEAQTADQPKPDESVVVVDDLAGLMDMASLIAAGPEQVPNSERMPDNNSDKAGGAKTARKNSKAKARSKKASLRKSAGKGTISADEVNRRFSYPVSLSDFSAEQEYLYIINDPHTKQADRIRATTLLEELRANAAAHDPNAKADPADVCAYLARANLYGQDPFAVLAQTHGLRKVCNALGKALNVECISITLGGKTVSYEHKSQCLKGSATDSESVGLSDGEPRAAATDDPAPPRADS